MIDREYRLSVSRQAKLLGISRGSVYYQRRPSSPADLALMRRMDALHVEYPYLLRQLAVARPHQVYTLALPDNAGFRYKMMRSIQGSR